MAQKETAVVEEITVREGASTTVDQTTEGANSTTTGHALNATIPTSHSETHATGARLHAHQAPTRAAQIDGTMTIEEATEATEPKAGTTTTEADAEDSVQKGGSTTTDVEDSVQKGGSTMTDVEDSVQKGGSTTTDVEDSVQKGGSTTTDAEAAKTAGRSTATIGPVLNATTPISHSEMPATGAKLHAPVVAEDDSETTGTARLEVKIREKVTEAVEMTIAETKVLGGGVSNATTGMVHFARRVENAPVTLTTNLHAISGPLENLNVKTIEEVKSNGCRNALPQCLGSTG